MRTPKSCLILGSGVGGLTLGALLARAGVDVTVLEAHPEYLGGWAHTIHANGYKFSAGPRYLFNFGPGQIGRRFLQKCALEEQVPLVELDRRGFDHIHVGDEEPIHVPNGWPEYEARLKERFPADAKGIGRFFSLCQRAFRVAEVIDEGGLILEPWGSALGACFWRRPRSTAWLLLHRQFTLHQAFEQCNLSNRVRAVLAAQGLVFLVPPESLSFFAYAAGTLLYHRGCHYPADDMEGLVGAVAAVIEQHNGRILRNQPVVSVTTGTGGVEAVTTQTGERFAADAVVVNFDPKTFLTLLEPPGGVRLGRLPPYKYSGSVTSLFLGITDRRILEPCFGKWNIWYSSGADAAHLGADPLGEPRTLYLNSPTLVKGRNNDSPPGHATVTAFAPCSYEALRNLGPEAKQAWKCRHTETVLDVIEKRFAPGLRRHVAAQYFDTPEDKERVLRAPQGNVYGRPFEPREIWTKVPFKGILPHLYFVSAYVTFPGIAAVIQGACRLYGELTGDLV